MEVRIGVVHTMKELSVELDGEVEALVTEIDQALAAEQPTLWLVDRKGRRVGVPVDKVAYIEISADDGAKQVGFGRST